MKYNPYDEIEIGCNKQYYKQLVLKVIYAIIIV